MRGKFRLKPLPDETFQHAEKSLKQTRRGELALDEQAKGVPRRFEGMHFQLLVG
jgi:hypothetical protein